MSRVPEVQSTPGPPRIAVVIPALDEEAAIGQVVREIPLLAAQIIVVDNGSTDGTAAEARAAGATVVAESRRGYGFACRRGIREAAGADVIVFLDADHSDFPQEMTALVAPIIAGDADLVIGSRLRGRREKGALRAHALAANILFAWVLRTFYGLPVTDIGPFRAIQAETLRALDMQEGAYGWTLEMMLKAARLGARVIELPVSYRRRLGRSKVSGSLRASLKAGCRMIYTLGRYGK